MDIYIFMCIARVRTTNWKLTIYSIMWILL